MKKIAVIILCLAVLCICLCGCDMRDGVISDKNGTLTDNDPVHSAVPSEKPDTDNKNGAVTPVQPQATSIPGTSAITP